MSPKTLLSLFYTAAVVLLLQPATTNSSDADADFIRASCSGTLYPDLCFDSLSGYSSAVQEDPAQLAKVAISLSLTKARQMAAYVSNISRQAEYSLDARAASAVHDCLSNMRDAVDEIQGSLKQMKQLGGGTSAVRFQMSNVQTWMSAALTDEETCTDGFQDVGDAQVKADVYNRIADVKKFTSNALALVNLYAHKVSPP